MGYMKVYLTIEEEEDIKRIKAQREKEGRLGAAFNAILKEGLEMVVQAELDRGREGTDQGRRTRRRGRA